MLRPNFRRAGFSLTELLVAASIFVVGGAVAFPFLSGDVSLYARNFSINKSNNSLRYSLQTLKRDIDMSIEPPLLMSYSVSGTGVATFTPLASTATSGQAIITWVNLGPAYQMLPASGASGPIKPSAGIVLNRHIGTAGTEELSAPLPQVGDRLLFMNPAPYSTGMPETVVMNGVSVVKPGRLITRVSPASDPAPPATPTTSFTVWIDGTNPLPVDTSGNCTVLGNNSVYIFREVAYAAYTLNDSTGKPVERQLCCYPSTATLTNPQIITHDLDPAPQEIDTNTGAVVQPFNYYGGRGTLNPLSVNLPIRALDYAHAIADRNLGGAATDTSSTEFNVFLRSNPTMGIKVRLDDTSLNQITLN